MVVNSKKDLDVLRRCRRVIMRDRKIKYQYLVAVGLTGIRKGYYLNRSAEFYRCTTLLLDTLVSDIASSDVRIN
jgi:hypothetical protein